MGKKGKRNSFKPLTEQAMKEIEARKATQSPKERPDIPKKPPQTANSPNIQVDQQDNSFVTSSKSNTNYSHSKARTRVDLSNMVNECAPSQRGATQEFVDASEEAFQATPHDEASLRNVAVDPSLSQIDLQPKADDLRTSEGPSTALYGFGRNYHYPPPQTRRQFPQKPVDYPRRSYDEPQTRRQFPPKSVDYPRSYDEHNQTDRRYNNQPREDNSYNTRMFTSNTNKQKNQSIGNYKGQGSGRGYHNADYNFKERNQSHNPHRQVNYGRGRGHNNPKSDDWGKRPNHAKEMGGSIHYDLQRVQIESKYECEENWDDDTVVTPVPNSDEVHVVPDTTKANDSWSDEVESVMNSESAKENIPSGISNTPDLSSNDQKYKNESLMGGDSSEDPAWSGNLNSYTASTYQENYKKKESFRRSDSYNRKSEEWNSPRQRRDPRMERVSQNIFDTSHEKKDQEYIEFEKYEAQKGDKADLKRVNEVERDLFDMPKEYSLAHCVAEDMKMGSGIAVQFKRDFKEVDVLLNQRQKQGGLALLEQNLAGGTRYIYYLVTKRQSTGKPTRLTFWSSLQKMRDHIRDHKVEKLAIPRLGCGLDRLEWSTVKSMIEFVFKDVDVEIVVCSLLQTADNSPPRRDFRSLKVVNVDIPVHKIESYTIILYFSTVDGHVTNVMTELDKKFNFLSRFQHTRRQLGDAIKHFDRYQNYILYGCIVKKHKDDLIDFVSLKRCLMDINKQNNQDKYEYVGLQVLEDEKEDLIDDKVLAVLRLYLRNIDIYICSNTLNAGEV